jgi:hypothetical protein
MKFPKPPIVFEVKEKYQYVFTNGSKVWITFDADRYPIGRVFRKMIDGKRSTYRVIAYRYIGKDLVAIVLDKCERV